jgi:hypothetical protein
LDLDMLGRLKEALSESDLTIKVDLVDLRAVDPAFRRMIEARWWLCSSKPRNLI